jgi:drug/metabolite transporter (DMT)-like permease
MANLSRHARVRYTADEGESMNTSHPQPAPRGPRRGQLEVIAAAVAFAASVPAGKLLLADVSPLALSGAFYFSAGILSALLVALNRAPRIAGTSNLVRGSEWLWLAGAVLSGGVLAPLLLLAGLRQVSGNVAGLLLNFEAVFTVGLGDVFSGESLGRRGWLGAVAVVLGAALLSLPGPGASSSPSAWGGIALIVGACALWGFDNNLTQRVSLRDARQIVAIKGLAGGTTSLLLAAAVGALGYWTPLRVLAVAAVGAVSFGLSIALFVRGLRRLGVLQTGMLFALAPGIAAVLSWVFLGERVALVGVAALGVMTAGALLLVLDRHEHRHAHAALEHAHEHTHDEHHDHPHTPEQVAETPHAHPHAHEPLVHGHPHQHDVHHRHRH